MPANLRLEKSCPASTRVAAYGLVTIGDWTEQSLVLAWALGPYGREDGVHIYRP